MEETDSPAKLGRFTLLERVAEGGMGVVFAAYDPELDRKVAIKLLRREATDESMRKRIVREAQAMAKISHPNVAQVYEVGEHQGGTFIAMEFVRGETLREWQKQDGRPWRDVLEVYVQAGLGLAAAHAAGLVHRDFKPDNAIVGRDCRVRVLDFGLARTGEAETTLELETRTVLPAPRDDALATPLTHAGSIMGTPAYMAPEQFLGEEVTAKTDQFALCVSLWEGLYGERPFAGSTRADLVANLTRGRMREPAKNTRVPAWLRAVLVRGLAVGPADRFATTDALLTALESDPSRRRRRVMLAIASVAALALVVAGVEGFRGYDRARKIAACEAEGAIIEEVWSAEASARVRDGLLATNVSYAPFAAEHVTPWLDDQAQAWREHSTLACMNASVHETWDADTLDRARWCLDERRLELASLVAELGRADAQVVQRAVSAAAGLTKVSPCLDAQTLANLPPPPDEDARGAIAEIRIELAHARTLQATGKYAEALDVARPARERAAALAWPPLSAAAQELTGVLLSDTGSFAESEAALVAAYIEGARASAWDVADSAAVALMFTIGAEQARHAEGRTWATHAEVASTHAGDPLGLREASRVNGLATLESEMGEYGRAKALHQHALALSENARGPDHVGSAGILNQLALVHSAMGEYDEAKAIHERVLAIREDALGPDHPIVATTLGNLVNVHADLGAYGEAKALGERSLAILEKALGPDHPGVAIGLNNLANLHYSIREYTEAKALYERALVIFERALGPDHPSVAASLGNLANVAHHTGVYGEARALMERALVIQERALGPEHPAVAHSLGNLGNILADMRAYDEAKTTYDRALAIREQALGSEHPDLATPLLGLAMLALAESRPEDAVPLADRAVRLREQGKVPPAYLAEARVLLARALWDAPVDHGRDRARAIKLATEARDAYRLAKGEAAQLAKVETWLVAHRQP